MTLNRRDFLTRLIGGASVTALSRNSALLRPLLASASPADLAALILDARNSISCPPPTG